MKYSKNEIKVGFVVVVALSFLTTFVIVLMGSNFWKKTVNYTATFYMSAGLEPGDLVRYAGMRVGKITSVDISPADPTEV